MPKLIDIRFALGKLINCEKGSLMWVFVTNGLIWTSRGEIFFTNLSCFVESSQNEIPSQMMVSKFIYFEHKLDRQWYPFFHKKSNL